MLNYGSFQMVRYNSTSLFHTILINLKKCKQHDSSVNICTIVTYFYASYASNCKSLLYLANLSLRNFFVGK